MNIKEEIWKDVIDYEGRYKVSNLGRVMSLFDRNGKARELILSTTEKEDTYCRLSLYKNTKVKHFNIHTLVARAFLNPNYLVENLVVNHINFIKNDNRLSNLEVTTYRENGNKKHLPSSSKYTGVYWDEIKKKWSSRVSINRKSKHLGYFDIEIEAHEYYEAAMVCIRDNRVENIKVKCNNFSSKYKGVSWCNTKNRWKSSIYIKGKYKFLGYFVAEEKANESYQNAKKPLTHAEIEKLIGKSFKYVKK